MTLDMGYKLYATGSHGGRFEMKVGWLLPDGNSELGRCEQRQDRLGGLIFLEISPMRK